MSNLCRATGFLVLATVFYTAPTLAAPIDEAKTLLAQKDYDKVDQVLAKELAARTPDVEALKTSLAAAMATGRPVTAEARISAILKQKQDAELLLSGAKIAEILNDDRAALTRYLAYARAETRKCASLDAALTYVLQRDGYLDEFRKYVDTFGPSEHAWRLGEAQWRLMAGHRDGEKLLGLADYLMQKWPAKPNITAVHYWLQQACDSYIFGREPRARYWQAATVAAKYVPNAGDALRQMVGNGGGGLNDQEHAQFVIDSVKATGLPPTDAAGWFTLARNVKDEATRLQLGRDFLATEKIYLDSKNPEDYQRFVQMIIQLPEVFNIKDKALVTREALDQKFDVVRSRIPPEWQRFRFEIETIGRSWPQDQAARTAFLKKHFAVLDGTPVAELLDSTKNENFDQVVAEHLKGKGLLYTCNFRGTLLGRYGALHKKADLLSATRDYLAANPYTFNQQHVRENVMNNAELSLAEKFGVLRGCFTKTGPSGPMTELFKQMAADNNWAAKPEFQAAQKEYGAAAAPTDPAMRAYAVLATLPQNSRDPSKAVYDAAARFLQEYKGSVPGDGPDAAKDLAEMQAAAIYLMHRDHVWDNGTAFRALAELWAPRLGRGGVWSENGRGMVYRLKELGHRDLIYKIAPIYLAMIQPDDKGDPGAWDLLSEADYPNDGKPIIFAPYYAKMGESAAKFLWRQLISNQKINGPNLLGELDKVISAPGFEFKDREWWSQLIENLNHNNLVTPERKAPLTLSRALLRYQWREGTTTKQPNTWLELAAIATQSASGQRTDGLKLATEYLETVKQNRPERLLETYAMLLTRIDVPEEQEATLTPGMRYHTLLKVLKPLYEQVPPDQWRTAPLQVGVFGALGQAEGRFKDKPEIKEILALKCLLAKMLAAGAQFGGGDGNSLLGAQETAMYAYASMMQEPLNQENWGEVWGLAAPYMAFLRARFARTGPDEWNRLLGEHLGPLVAKLETKGNFEIAFALTTAAQRCGDAPEGARKQLALIKGRVASRIPGLIPVAATDPTYDLFAAAHALVLGDETKAWELTRSKLALLSEEWTSLDPAYVAWTVEQMRKQKLLKPALNLAMTVLLREKELDPEVAARVSLAKGETYMDMENYQAARIELDSLRNNPVYGKTEAGTQALYRLIHLMLVTKDYTTAEGLLARLVDSDQVAVQAEGYFLYAKMAYLQQDFKEAAINLRKVKERVANHVEAALLQGEVNLHLPGGLQFTEVEIGNPKLSTAVIPGQMLTLKLQDSNLSVARGAASVPVVIKTSKGDDEEHIKLLPSSANKTLFVGTIPTMLGQAKKSDMTLELRGDDQITYEIEQSFQKANRLSYAPKTMEVRYDARLTASSGQILTEAEQEKIEMERRMQEVEQSQQVDRVKRYERDWNMATVRPGGNIFVQVVDPAANTGDVPGRVKINLHTSSGDVLEGFELVETGPHTGIFRGAARTGIPRPKANASDTEEGRGVAGVINSTAPAPWVSLADGKKPKWLEVDTMSSYPVAAFQAEIPTIASIREVTLEGQLGDDYQELAHYPPRTKATQAGVHLQVVGENRGDSLEEMRGLIKTIAPEPILLDGLSFDRSKLPPPQGDAWFSLRMTGAFYLPKNRSLDLKFLQTVPGNDWQLVFLFIDGQQVFAGMVNERTVKNVKRVELTKGVHQIEIVAKDYPAGSKIILGYGTDEGTFEPLPKDWFSEKAHPEITTYLKPKATIKVVGETLVATLEQPQRLRKVRLVFNDFAGTAVSVKSVAVKDDQGQAIVPVKEDFSSGKKSQLLQIAPGDRIHVSYDDSRGVGGPKTLSADLNAAFNNGSVILANEEIVDRPGRGRVRSYFPARRCRPGDQLMVLVNDHDADVSDERDTVDVVVTSSSGERLAIKALETEPEDRLDLNNHAGVFMATLKIGDRTAKDQIKVLPGDKITVSYLDRENTDPGVPVERNYSVLEASGGTVQGLVYRTSVKQAEDTSELARAKRNRIKIKLGRDVTILKDLVVARHPDYQPEGKSSVAAKKDEEIVVAVGAPLLFEITCPKNALNSASVMNVTAVTDSEIKAAAREGKEPVVLKVPLSILPIDQLAAAKGFQIQLQSAVRRDASQMLREGTFAGIVRLQVGKRGDAVSDLVAAADDSLDMAVRREMDATGFNYRVPTLRVSGADVVHLKYEDPQTKRTTEWKVRLLADGRMELMDSTFTVSNDTIHLGDKFHLRVVDPDRDRSDARDTVKVRAKAASGDELSLTLTETLPHSGVFETSFQPELIGEKGADGKLPPVPADKGDKLYVTFGDNVAFSYDDPECVAAPGTMTVTQVGRVAKGSDANLAIFSKQFKDPEMAVKTQFLMAEALFEMAKEHRKLEQKKKADDEIARGKAILEEAIRDYPRTSLAAQGDYLLANLAQELGQSNEAISRYAHVISTYPDSEFAPASQFKKGLCYEKMENFDAACEEYVKLTYVYPDSGFVVDATLRLGTYYYKKENYPVAAKIFYAFKQKNPTHKMAPRALFLAAQCSLKQKSYVPAAKVFAALVEEYQDDKALRSEAMYWKAECYFKANDHVNAYRGFKRLTWDYPDSEWAKYARGRLAEDIFSGMIDE